MEKYWHIYFERSGGFTGIPVKVEVDSNDLPPDERDDLHRMIAESKFFELEQSKEQANAMPDSFQYTLIIEGNERKRKMNLSEQEIPDELRILLRYLTTKARKI
jgi:hypothetical protein